MGTVTNGVKWAGAAVGGVKVKGIAKGGQVLYRKAAGISFTRLPNPAVLKSAYGTRALDVKSTQNLVAVCGGTVADGAFLYSVVNDTVIKTSGTPPAVGSTVVNTVYARRASNAIEVFNEAGSTSAQLQIQWKRLSNDGNNNWAATVNPYPSSGVSATTTGKFNTLAVSGDGKRLLWQTSNSGGPKNHLVHYGDDSDELIYDALLPSSLFSNIDCLGMNRDGTKLLATTGAVIVVKLNSFTDTAQMVRYSLNAVDLNFGTNTYGAAFCPTDDSIFCVCGMKGTTGSYRQSCKIGKEQTPGTFDYKNVPGAFDVLPDPATTYAVEFSPDGNYLAVGQGGLIYIYSRTGVQFKNIAILEPLVGAVMEIVWDGNLLVCTGQISPYLAVFKVSEGK